MIGSLAAGKEKAVMGHLRKASSTKMGDGVMIEAGQLDSKIDNQAMRTRALDRYSIRHQVLPQRNKVVI